MDLDPIPNDDVMDVSELTQKIQNAVSNILQDNEVDVAISALISSFVNEVIFQCDNVSEILFYQAIIQEMFISRIKSIRLKE